MLKVVLLFLTLGGILYAGTYYTQASPTYTQPGAPATPETQNKPEKS